MVPDIDGFLRYFHGVNQRALRDFSGLGPAAETWRPPAGEGESAWSVGEIVSHMAGSRLFFCRAYATLEWRAEPWPGSTGRREEWPAALQGSADAVRELLEGTPDDWLGRPVPMLDGSPKPGWRVLLLMVEHEVHHRAQVQAYAGLYGWGTTHIYGRSAQEAGLEPPR